MERAPKIQVYRDATGDWRWRLVASNGRIVADSGEGYRRKRAALAAASKYLPQYEIVLPIHLQ
jgi:uncharacterized protein YegP (UPF0339 family)